MVAVCGCALTCRGGGVFHLACLYYLIDLPEQLSFVNECNYVIKNEVFLSLRLPTLSDRDCQETKHHLCTSYSLPLAGGKHV